MTDSSLGDAGGKTLIKKIEQDPLGRLLYRTIVLAFFALIGWVYITDRHDNAERFMLLAQRQRDIQVSVGKQDTALALAAQNIEAISHSLMAEHDRIDRANTRIDGLIERMEAMSIDITKLQDHEERGVGGH